jgi:glyoxylase-like metal-dependent hydrolase (beta-lactamase superfamily II)
MVHVEVIATEELGDRSYLAHDGRVAVVVDPQRDIDWMEAALARLGVRCVLVVETHIHNDYVSGRYNWRKTRVPTTRTSTGTPSVTATSSSPVR